MTCTQLHSTKGFQAPGVKEARGRFGRRGRWAGEKKSGANCSANEDFTRKELRLLFDVQTSTNTWTNKKTIQSPKPKQLFQSKQLSYT